MDKQRGHRHWSSNWAFENKILFYKAAFFALPCQNFEEKALPSSGQSNNHLGSPDCLTFMSPPSCLVSSTLLHKYACQYHSHLETLNFRDCFWIPSYQIVAAVQRCTNLRELVLTGSRLTITGLIKILVCNLYYSNSAGKFDIKSVKLKI